ncbi:hypothetical protein [Oscillibacter ruminantium]|uniref:hypothetical protein n=1 Tax=Oscillibacter ruminantium TaxID=1263547 RepID=UPI0002F0A060|nr:hypothetical protein [Oscillibacter ruminantium]
MNITRKIARRMAKKQMALEGIQHPCRKFNKPGVIFMGGSSAGKTSYFASCWESAAARYLASLNAGENHKGKRGSRAGRKRTA